MISANNETICFIWRKKILNNYIKSNNLRSTPERFKILELIHDMNNHFTIQELFYEITNSIWEEILINQNGVCSEPRRFS